MQWLLDFVNNFVSILWNLLKLVFDGLWLIITVAFQITLDGLLAIVLGIVQALDVGSLIVNATAAWGLLDPNIAWMVSAMGISQGLTMVGYAYMIRLTLNLIPAALTRV